VLDDGRRVARLFELAQEEAQLRARPLAWEADTQGWRFLEFTPNGWQPLSRAGNGDVLGPGRWRLTLDSLAATMGGQGGPVTRLVFGREPIGNPQQLVMQRGDTRVVVQTDGSGRFIASAS
jgi:general secretion pathway protein H